MRAPRGHISNNATPDLPRDLLRQNEPSHVFIIFTRSTAFEHRLTTDFNQTPWAYPKPARLTPAIRVFFAHSLEPLCEMAESDPSALENMLDAFARAYHAKNRGVFSSPLVVSSGTESQGQDSSRCNEVLDISACFS